MTITFEIPDDVLAIYSSYIEVGTGVSGPSTAEDWADFFSRTVIPDYMAEKFGVQPGVV